MVLSLFGRPNDAQESLPRDSLLSVKKFLTEARSLEIKIVLGWLIDARRFLISLPWDKFTTWIISLQVMKSDLRVFRESLRTMLGRLNHTAYVVPLVRHFLGRLYQALAVAKRIRSVKLQLAQVQDIEFWISFLHLAHQGLSINHITFRSVQRLIRVDDCPQGLGGYCFQSGIAWRYLLPPDLIGRLSLNTLEFLAS